ncbi:Stk1 family PASTA domain-containing Ser/Thr kinase [Ornithinimicrobium pekingense]|uniref:non-specific serine/threonine protein kinase n=1 Tax=Ornithinimicrobium pekingense TaxID=384677 RepID=A0ABQ2F7G8_9MICO|nr:Stk1 family PASTA domain-containing Ser/Thr kinase [Ornithinimicrobium pekingense]GGK69446.1 serine/threonine protein kinase [Ornithinimicrobium pekingense]
MSAPTNPVIDRVVDGRYQVEAELARGGMATVYRARDLRLDRPVALKVMREDLARDDTFVRRFVHEARVAARLQHPHIVSVYDQGEDDGVVFLAMELVEGSTLRDVISRRAPLSARDALTLLVPVVEALATAHAAGLVHRDVKPENVLLSRRGGAVKVTDFGLARLEGNPHVTTEMLWGTAAYLAPEQVETGSSDARTDVYAAALLFFELLAARKAFPGDDPLRVAYEHVHGGVPHVRELVPTVPPAVEDLILRAAATEPADRPADAAELLDELRHLERSLTAAELDSVPQVRDHPDHTVPVYVDGAHPDRTQVVRHDRGRPPRGHGTGRSRPGPSATRQIPVRRDGIPAASTARPSGDARFARTSGNRTPAPRPRRRSGSGAAWVLSLLLVLLAAAGGYGFWYLTQGPAVHSAMPTVVGLTEQQARTALDAEELDPVVVLAYSEEVPTNVVVSADAEPGTELRHGTDVELVVSRGPERYAVPTLRGATAEEARSALEEVNLALGATTQEYDETVPAGQVLSSSPAAGEQLPPGTSVSVVLSRGQAPVDVPDVTGRTQQEASALLTSAGLTVQVAPEQVFDDEVPAGSVVTQSPGPSSVARGTPVTLTVSKGPETVAVPDVVGRQFRSAEEELVGLGLTVKREDIAGGFFETVREQSVEAGTQVPRGTEVVLRVV